MLANQPPPQPIRWHGKRAKPQFSQALPLSLYIHLPWCVRKCPYCDFNSHAVIGDAWPEDEYIDALCADLTQSLPAIWGRPVRSIFIGGGTPSLFSAASMARLLAFVRSVLPLMPGAEVTMEANPGTFDQEHFAGYRAAGVNRLSIGAQSFDNRALHALGRIHQADAALAAIACAQNLFDAVNIDLMLGLPGQDLTGYGRDLATTLAQATAHVSIYQLTMEPNTAFAVAPPKDLPDEDGLADMHDLLAVQTAAAGYRRYEVSAYAQPGFRCQHNLNYWQYGDYLGIGAGAHSKLSFPERIVREVRQRQPKRYLQAQHGGQWLQEQREVSADDLPFEFALNAFRLIDGVPVSLFAERTGLVDSPLWRRGLERAQSRGLLLVEGETLRPSSQGIDFLNDLQAMFLP